MKSLRVLSTLALCSLLLAAGSGCVTKGWQGLIPDKDVDLKGLKGTLATPWGSQLFTIDELHTRVDRQSKNPLPPLPVPQP